MKTFQPTRRPDDNELNSLLSRGTFTFYCSLGKCNKDRSLLLPPPSPFPSRVVTPFSTFPSFFLSSPLSFCSNVNKCRTLIGGQYGQSREVKDVLVQGTFLRLNSSSVKGSAKGRLSRLTAGAASD